MEAAGATLIEETAVDGAMGLGALSHAMAVRKVQRNIARWASRYRVVAHIAVDSPAANFPICRMMKKQGACVAHLVAPQLWAWGGWRIKKLRRLSDLVLCLLPFEESWFMSRQVNARFIGHPVINRSIDEAELQQRRNTLPQGSPRILVLPGSRSGEVRKNTRMLVAAFTEIQGRFRGTTGLVVASDDRVARQVRKLVPAMPTGLHLAIGDLDAAINWCDLALTVSGTVTLDLARQTRPMIGVYKTDPLSWIGSKLLLRTRYKLLPNIVLRQEVVPEFVPCLGRVGPIVQEAAELLKDTRNLAKVSEGLRHVTKQFEAQVYSSTGHSRDVRVPA